MKKLGLALAVIFSANSYAQLKSFNEQEHIKASEINQNFNQIKSIFQAKQQAIPFSIYSSGQVIDRTQLESDFELVRELGIEVSPLEEYKVKAAELNTAFLDMLAGAQVYDDIPLANNGSFSINEDIILNNTLSFVNTVGTSQVQPVIQPTHGSLQINPTSGTFQYSPSLNYNGPDSFTYKVFDGSNNSNEATVSLMVNAVNDAPVAAAQSLNLTEDTATPITLSGTDIDSATLSYIIPTPPQHGTITGTYPNAIYTPGLNYNGTDSFSFQVNDGELNSAAVNVNLTITPVNDAPVALEQSIATNEDTSKSITFTGSDAENSALTYILVSGPSFGTYTGSLPNVVYSPGLNFSGTDSFRFKVKDGVLESPEAVVTITVNPINDIPVAVAQSVSTIVNESKSGTLTASDVEGSTLTYSLVNQGTKGFATVNSNGNFTYVPNNNSYTSDIFSVRAFDGVDYSLPVNVSVAYLTSRTCSDAAGSGNQSFNTTSLSWNNCLYTSCLNSKVPSTNQLECVYVNATGGSVAIQGNYKVHTFTSTQTFNLISGATTGYEVLVVAGGGAAGTSRPTHGGPGGGGAGGLKHQTINISLGNHTVGVGDGGAAPPLNSGTCYRGNGGGSSYIGSIISTTGGGGGGSGCDFGPAIGGNGGSGGGGGYDKYSNRGTLGYGISGEGYNGGSALGGYGAGGSGGGGAGGPGSNNINYHYGGPGGSGVVKTITGSSVTYAAGGHGAGAVGQGTGSNGTPNSGNGGWAGYAYSTPGAGGSGIVVIKYLYK